MNLEELGYNKKLDQYRIEQKLDAFDIGRVVAEHKERYVVRTATHELDAEITGNMRFAAQSREDFPAVGDWVAMSIYDNDFAVIHQVFPRFSVLKRQAVGQLGAAQIIAANIDYGFLVQAVDRDFNINRLERYLTICHASGVEPLIVLTKTDLVDETQLLEILERLKQRHSNIPVFAISNHTQHGYDLLKKHIAPGKTYCMLGSSGVGKSTLVNNLAGNTLMKTDAISTHTNKGRHVTSHRELIVLENGGILIDNPGMREVGIAEASGGLEATFDTIAALSKDCKFKDCTHTSETGCTVLAAIENGELDRASYENFQKMEREKAHYESTVADRRKKDKAFGKMVKEYLKGKKE
jgi:ribosome biogenesis GTPase